MDHGYSSCTPCPATDRGCQIPWLQAGHRDLEVVNSYDNSLEGENERAGEDSQGKIKAGGYLNSCAAVWEQAGTVLPWPGCSPPSPRKMCIATTATSIVTITPTT